MKPLRLKLEGLHSFREAQIIDFTALCDAGVFGIFGPTGSGKSTILDAITLALYGKVERANKNTQGIINHAAERVLVEFSFELGVPGQKHSYRVERLYKRVGENNVNARSSRLIALAPSGEVVLADKDREVTQQIQELLGLTVEDFTRAVVLPQGKFDKFLSLRDAERRTMLQRLFALEDYGDKLNERIKKRLDFVNKQLISITAEQHGLGDASAAALEQCRTGLQAAKQREQTAAAERTKALEQFELHKEVWTFQQELLSSQQAADEHRHQNTTIEALEHQYANALKAEQVRPFLETARKGAAQLRLVRTRQEQAERDFLAASELEQRQRQTYEQCQEQRRLQEPELIQLKTKLEAAETQEIQLQNLKQRLLELGEQVQSGNSLQKTLNNQLAQHDTAYQQAALQLAALKQRAQEILVTPEYRRKLAVAVEALRECLRLAAQVRETTAETAVKQEELHKLAAQEAQSAAHVAAGKELVEQQEKVLEAKQKACPAAENDLLVLQEGLERGRAQVTDIERCELELTQAMAQTAAAEEIFNKAAVEVEQIGVQLGQHRQMLEQAQAVHSQLTEQYRTLEQQNYADLLAAGLQADMPCPVCGSTHHPSPASQHVGHDMTQLRENVQKAEVELVQAQEIFQTVMLTDTQARERMQNSRNQLVLSQQQVQQREESRKHYRSLLKENSREKTLPELKKLLEQLEKRLAEAKNARQSWVKEVEALQQEVAKAKDNLAAAEKAHSAAATSLTSGNKGLADLQEKLSQLAQQIADQEARLTELLTAVRAEQVTVSNSVQAVVTACQQTAVTSSDQSALSGSEHHVFKLGNEQYFLEQQEQLVADCDREAKENQAAQELLEQQLLKVSTEREQLSGQAKKLELDLAGWSTEYQAVTSQVQNMEAQINAVTGGRSLKIMLTETVNNLNTIVTGEEKAREQLELVRVQREKAEGNRTATTKELQLAVQTAAENETKLAEVLSAAQFATALEAEQAWCPPQECSAMEQSIKTYREREKELNAEIRRLNIRLNGRSLTEEQWTEYQELKQNAEIEYESAVKTASVAEAQLKELELKHSRWQLLEQDGAELKKLKERLETLQRLFRGNAFVEFIAEEQVLNVALAASVRLKQMTRNRYALEVDSEGGFVMRDDNNGGVKRPVSTLSGGETFLTSLALALALSAQIQLKGQYPLEFFFLDEGFGTLDPELLDKVMSTLERLPSDQMTIGVISHVPEMRHRMARRLVIEPAQPGGAGSRVSFEVM